MDQNRIFGGNPLGVILRLVVVSIIVGIVMSALDVQPDIVIYYLRMLVHRLSHMGFGIFESALAYFALGAVIVIPIWLVVRLLGALGGRRTERRD